MKTITVSESALDSINRMGEADAARIAELEKRLASIAKIALMDGGATQTRFQAMRDIHDFAALPLRVSPNVQTIVKGEN